MLGPEAANADNVVAALLKKLSQNKLIF